MSKRTIALGCAVAVYAACVFVGITYFPGPHAPLISAVVGFFLAGLITLLVSRRLDRPVGARTGSELLLNGQRVARDTAHNKPWTRKARARQTLQRLSFERVITEDGLHVLVVENDEDHLDWLMDTFTKLGCPTRGTSTIKDAWYLIEKHKPHLILCGDDLEQGQEFALCTTFAYKLKSNHYRNPHKCSDAYMVRLTSSPYDTEKVMAAEFGFDEYISKPIDRSNLIAWLNAARNKFPSQT